MLHAILVDSMIERIEGSPEFAEAVVKEQRKAGHASEYLFAARSEQAFEHKRQSEIQSARLVYRCNKEATAPTNALNGTVLNGKS